MREMAIEPTEVKEAKERFKVGLVRLAVNTEKARAGGLEEVPDIAPHLLSMRGR